MTNLQSMRDKRLIKSSAQCWTVLGVAFQLLKPFVSMQERVFAVPVTQTFSELQQAGKLPVCLFSTKKS